MKKTVRALVLVAAAAGMAALASCNTVEGFGKDMELGGERLQGAVR